MDENLNEYLENFSSEERAVLGELAQDILAARRLAKRLAWLGGISLGLVAAVYHLVSIWRGVSPSSASIHGGD
jgi:hypothetical protein